MRRRNLQTDKSFIFMLSCYRYNLFEVIKTKSYYLVQHICWGFGALRSIFPRCSCTFCTKIEQLISSRAPRALHCLPRSSNVLRRMESFDEWRVSCGVASWRAPSCLLLWTECVSIFVEIRRESLRKYHLAQHGGLLLLQVQWLETGTHGYRRSRRMSAA